MDTKAPRIVYEVSAAELREAMHHELAELQKTAILSRYADRYISADTVAEIHGVHRNTVISYARAGLLDHTMSGKLYKFQLSYVLDIDFSKLKKLARA